MKSPINDFWGKLAPNASGDEWHPLIHHCADVAAVASALLALPTWRSRLARLAKREDLDEVTCSRLTVITALHDLGKFNLGFQAKGRPDLGLPRRGHVAEGLGLLKDGGPEVFDALEASSLEPWGDALPELLDASIGHHGRPVSDIGATYQRTWWAPRAGLAPLQGVHALRRATQDWLPEAFVSSAPQLPDEPDFTHAFAGLVMLADWLGSDRRFFPYSGPDEDVVTRYEASRERAQAALLSMGLAVEHLRTEEPRRDPFSAVSPYSPRSAQRSVISLPLPRCGSVTVLESETGSGKTEAALARFVQLFEAGLVDGIYFALPTRTAATQIHRRVVDATKRAFGASAPPVVLAVPGYLRVDDSEGLRLAPFEVLWPDDGRFGHRGWAAEHPKRYLVGTVVVGTVDQVLLSSLQVGHAHLRATALLRHLLVVDEVHASDAYMTQILEEVLAHHRAAGGHTLLLSATLGGEARGRLLMPRSRTRPVRSFEECRGAAYPLVSTLEEEESCTSIVHDGRSKRVEIAGAPWLESPAQIAEGALEGAQRGAKVLVLRNTVRDCVDTQIALETAARRIGREELLFTCRGRNAPHHSRYARPDRESLDLALDAAFGKERPDGGCVVVATQTVQQSLDLDADWLLTDLCPMDVLLQRVGRLHRHERARPPGFEGAQVQVLIPTSRDLGTLIQNSGRGKHHHGLGSVYEDLRILEATWRQIEERPVWSIPDDARLLVELAVHSERLAQIVDEGGERWVMHAREVVGTTLAQRRHADLNLVDRSRAYANRGFPDDRKIASRLGEDDRLVAFLVPFTSPFDVPVSSLTLRSSWLRGQISEDELASDVSSAEGAVTFTFGARRFIYDRLGLRPVEEKLSADNVEDDQHA